MLHLDEAKQNALEALESLLEESDGILRLALINDLFGKLRVVLWAKDGQDPNLLKAKVDAKLRQTAGSFWTGDVWLGDSGSPADKLVYTQAWETSNVFSQRLRVGERHRTRSSWFQKAEEPSWSADGTKGGPPIITFYSFKGGVGRTTALAAFAMQRSRSGERVVVVDLDLDAPGAGTLFAADEKGTTAQWGAADYLLEGPVSDLDFKDYYHVFQPSAGTPGEGIFVVPAGNLSPKKDYLNKLARLDFEPPIQPESQYALRSLLKQIKEVLAPDWILLDARSGISEPAGVLLGGIAHLQVLFGTSSEQSWQGIRLVLDRIGAARVRESKPQLECLLVQAMIPEDSKASQASIQDFSDRALEEFKLHYFAADPNADGGDDEDRQAEEQTWYVRDSESSDAPHVPVPISYHPKLAHFENLDEVSGLLVDSKEYQAFADRIRARFLRTEE